MGLFSRKNKTPAEPEPEVIDPATGRAIDPKTGEFTHSRKLDKHGKPKKKSPANTAFKQQRLKAWQPILTPKNVLPTLFLVGIIFAPIGGLLIWGSDKVTSIRLDYTNCDTDAPTDGSSAPMPSYLYSLGSGHSDASFSQPKWSFSNDSSRELGLEAQCSITFDIPYDIGPSVMWYYRLTSYYQNHRRYVQSMDASQLIGDVRSVDQINNGNCKPITSQDGKAYYPCGLIANSVFNDTYGALTLTNPANGSDPEPYELSEKGIAWGNEYKKYTNNPPGKPSDYLPPPNWAKRYPNGYESFPQLASDEHFQNWMRTAALPTFMKLWGRNDNDVMKAGTYNVIANMNYPVRQFGGTKAIVISTVSWVGGRQPFLGWAYVATAALCVLLALAGAAKHLIKPRKMGDMSLLSWNQPTHAK